MAVRGRPISIETIKQIQRAAQILSVRKAARETGTSPNTVQKYRARGKQN